MSDDAGVALLAHVDAVHLDDALARVEPGGGCHRAWRVEKEEEVSRGDSYPLITVQVRANSG